MCKNLKRIGDRISILSFMYKRGLVLYAKAKFRCMYLFKSEYKKYHDFIICLFIRIFVHDFAIIIVHVQKEDKNDRNVLVETVSISKMAFDICIV